MKQLLTRSQKALHIQNLLKLWPTDAIRPSSVSVQTYLQSRLVAPPKPEEGQTSSIWSRLFRKSDPKPQTSEAQVSSQSTDDAPLLPDQSINAMYSLLENRYQKKYPLPNSLRYPASQSDYYDKLLKEFAEAPQRGLMGRIGKRLSGVFRWK